MADSAARPIHEPSAPTAPHGASAPEKQAMCAACGGYHGSVGVGRVCLEQSLAFARVELAAARVDSARLRAELDALLVRVAAGKGEP